VPSPGRLGAALLAIPVAGILHGIGRDLYDGYRGRLKTEPAIGQEEVPMSSPDAPDRADGMARTVDTPAGGPVVRDRRCQPTASPWQPLFAGIIDWIVYRQPAVIPLVGIIASPARPPAPWSPSQRFRPVDGSLSSAPRRIELGTLGSALRAGRAFAPI
jgi:hypothetical protein